ncbi:hypothetical protein DPMN_045528 [Dreissena polymorpha]|uniref:Uncharacterized protein n=1 Tax=Dreissena polymorpha TaxID=45954 RepID=A0A9D4D577_DREPO|nr:hypothetical protein DPMN_045528 [Dreissena polymorpha]
MPSTSLAGLPPSCLAALTMDPRLSKCFVRLNRLTMDDNGHCTAAPTSCSADTAKATATSSNVCKALTSQAAHMEQKVTIKLKHTYQAMHIRFDLENNSFYIVLSICSVPFLQSQVGAYATQQEEQWQLLEEDEPRLEMEEAMVSLKPTHIYFFKFINVNVYIHSYIFAILHSFRSIFTERTGQHRRRDKRVDGDEERRCYGSSHRQGGAVIVDKPLHRL